MPPTIHPFPELRALAEQYARERADARSRYGYTTATGGASWAAMGPVSRDIAVSVELNLLCDLTRHASRDAVCRLVAEKVGLDAAGGVTLTRQSVKGRVLADWLLMDWNGDESVVLRSHTKVTDPSEALSMIVTHLWPPE